MDEDWFIIGLEIVFLLFIAYDYKQYKLTKKKEYITNIILAVVFAIWVLFPMYSKYVGWTEEQRGSKLSLLQEDGSDSKLSKCLSDNIFKSYSYEEYKALDKKSKEYTEFIKESKEECLDDSWF